MTPLPSRFVLAGALGLLAVTHGPSAGAAQPAVQPAVKAAAVRVLALPQMDGANLKVHVIQVTYPPGAMSMAHRHPCPIIGYMISGTMRMQVSDQPVAEYKAGDTFFELPTDVHRMGSNPSKDTPAVFTATFVCDKDTPLSVPVTEAPAQ
jgi:quercetin dioxygenase-like cupin family protein